MPAKQNTSNLNAAKVRYVFDHAAGMVAAALQFSLPHQPDFTVGSVVLSAPEAVTIFKRSNQDSDDWRKIATATLEVAKALDNLDMTLREAAAGRGVAAAAQPPPLQPQQPGQAQPLPIADWQPVAVPLRVRAPKNAPTVVVEVMADEEDWTELGHHAAKGWTAMTQQLTEAWTSTYYLRTTIHVDVCYDRQRPAHGFLVVRIAHRNFHIRCIFHRPSRIRKTFPFRATLGICKNAAGRSRYHAPGHTRHVTRDLRNEAQRHGTLPGTLYIPANRFCQLGTCRQQHLCTQFKRIAA